MVGLPFFKFFCSEWIQGEITGLDLAPQGLFVNICAHYWFKDCKLSINYIKKIPFFNQEAFDELINANLIKVINDQISITFLNLQWDKRTQNKPKNQANGKKGGRPPKPKKNPNKTELITQTEPTTKGNRIDIPLKGDRYGGMNIGLDKSNHSNGYANSETLWPLWGQVSSKANLNEAERVIAEKQSLHWLDQILSSPLKEKMLERTWWILEHEPDMFETGQMTIQTLESIFDMTKA